MGDYDERDEDQQKEADGYECKHCGYTPTWYELNRGYCPNEGCPTKRKTESSKE